MGSLALGLAFSVSPTGGSAIAGGGDPDGRYQGELTDEDGREYGKVSFKVTKDGRRIEDFKALVLSVCVNPDALGGIELVEVPFVFDAVKVTRGGRFSKRETVTADPPSDAQQYYALSGQLKRNRVRSGRIVLEKRCASHETFSARRTRR